MRLAFIGTYPPRQCGIGTFTKNLFAAVNSYSTSDINGSYVVALNDSNDGYDYPDEVHFTIRQNEQEDYQAAAKYINLSGADCCLLQHEFGIYGGDSGVYILPLIYRLEIPLVVTLHTILKTPSYDEKIILQEICKMANKIVVMSRKAIEFLIDIYNVPKEKIVYIEHGVPDIKFTQEESKREFRLENRQVLLTFGLISRNKGIETVIKALPKVVEQFPNLLYIVLGKTHPNVLRHSGDEYRVYLTRLVNELGLQKNVILINKFASQRELFKYLHATDIYITPYLNEAQITSGTLAYAVGAGTAVVSTPYWHATEILDNGKGVLFDIGDIDQLTDVLLDLLSNPEKRNAIRQKAHEYGREITWPKVGSKYFQLCSETSGEEIPGRKEVIPFDIMQLPPFTMDHIKRLTDDTGIIQHAKFGIPNLKEGYCLDDNARAVLLAVMAIKQKRDRTAFELCPIYLSYIHYMQNKDGTFRNFLSFNRNYLDEIGSEDSFGRTMWALGYMLAFAPNDSYYQTAKEIFLAGLPKSIELTQPRAIANTIIGISYFFKSKPSDDGMLEVLKKQADVLVKIYKENSSPEWPWFEDELTYDNALLPLSLLHAAEFIKDDEILNIGMTTMDFLTDVTMGEGYLSIIGNQGWYKKELGRSKFAQQPVDAMAMVLMFRQAYILTREEKYLNKMFTCFMWFLGENDLRLSLYDYETGGCCDGLESYGVNRNQGAESTLAYLVSYLTILEVYEEYYS